MIQNLETTLRAGAVPQAPQFKPPSMTPPSMKPAGPTGASRSSASPVSLENKAVESKPLAKEERKCENEEAKASSKGTNVLVAQEGSSVQGDPLGSARNKVQDEITAEFVALMLNGTLRASEAAALATKKVMQRYGHVNMAQS